MIQRTHYRTFFAGLIVAGMALALPAHSAGHGVHHDDDDHGSHHGDAVSVEAGDETSTDTIVERRIKRFKSSGSDIQAIFKKHLGAGDYAAIDAAATRIGDWADVLPDHFPAGSSSEGAKPEIWLDFDDFTAKASANAQAARKLSVAAKSGDKAAVVGAAKALGGTCKSCHQSYRNKK